MNQDNKEVGNNSARSGEAGVNNIQMQSLQKINQ